MAAAKATATRAAPALVRRPWRHRHWHWQVGHGGFGGGGAGISVLRGAPSPTSVLVGTGGQGGAGKSGHCATFTKGWQRGDLTHTLVCSFQCTVLCGSLNGFFFLNVPQSFE